MAKNTRDEFRDVTQELAQFRSALGRLDTSSTPGIPELLGGLLRALDQATADMEATVPAALARLDQEVEVVSKMNAQAAQQLEEAQRIIAAPAPVPAVEVDAGLPQGHGQVLRGELLARFADPAKPAARPALAGDVHDLTSREWKESSPAQAPASPQPPAPQPPPKKPRGDDVGDMNSQDWR